jgi:release factor glutamine methyltransferase
VRGALQHAAAMLSASRSPRLDAEILLAHVLKVSRSRLYAWPEQLLQQGQQEAFLRLLERRAQGEPVAYLTGEKEFWSLPLLVGPATLIPREDTEVLVEQALNRLGQTGRVFDLGTGSGAVALALAHERPGCRVLASDCSLDALKIARRNAARLGLDNLDFVACNWLDGLGRADLIVSNPPYIAPRDPHLKQGDLRFEPLSALVAKERGLAVLRRLIHHAPAHLAPGGWLLLEHGYDQASQVKALFARHAYTEIFTQEDYHGQPRVSGGRFS